MLHEFYTKYRAEGVAGVEKVAGEYQDELIDDYAKYLKKTFEPRLEKLFKKYTTDLNSLTELQSEIAKLAAREDAIDPLNF